MLLLAATLLMCLTLATAFVVLHRQHAHHGAAVEPPAHPLNDDETMEQVVSAARQFVEAGRLETIHATYLLMSCRTEDEPPYQGTVYLDFALPPVATAPDYLSNLARTMAKRGWKPGPDPNQHPGGEIMVNNGVTAHLPKRRHTGPRCPANLRGVPQCHRPPPGRHRFRRYRRPIAPLAA